MLPTIDFETYSEAGYYVDPFTGKVKGVGSKGKGGLSEVGTPVYAEHHSAEVLTLSYDLLDGLGRRRWRPGQPNPADLLQYVNEGGPVAAWNITFEWYIWNFICVRRHGWPPLNFQQCHCDMAKSRRYSTPGSLDLAAQVLGGSPKDKQGKALIRKLTRPQTPTKARPSYRWTRETAQEDFEALDEYCDQDVVAEMTTASRIPDLTAYERETWIADQSINARGVQVDVAALDDCLHILSKTEQRFTEELRAITGGRVNSVNATAQFVAWLASQGVHTQSIDADNVTELLALESLPATARRALEIRQALGGANVKKLRKLKLQISSDGRLRDQYTYCGADRTGRWSAGGVQLQNITSKGPKSKTCRLCGLIVGKGCKVEVMGVRGECPHCGSDDWADNKEWTVDAVGHALKAISTRDLDHVIDAWGDPCGLLAGCLRGLFVAKEGHTLICCDFSAIEAVVLACLSRCQWRIDVFNTHGKIYEMSASKISGVPFEDFAAYKDANGMHHPLRKSLGKVAELACFTRNTQVLTKRGYVRIAEVKPTDQLWDGVEWVTSDGVIHKGKREVITLDGVGVTPEHPVSLNGSWKEARLLASSKNTLRQALATGSENLPSCATKSGTSGQLSNCKNESMNSKDVYDIVNAGPRHRFTIKTDSGHLLVHNSGYGGWVGAWKAFGAEEHFENDRAIKDAIIGWRDASPEIVEFWGGQHRQVGLKPWDSVPELFGLEGAVVAAILNPGQCFAVGDISYGVAKDILYCRLPSGRLLHYHRPRLDTGEDHFRRPAYKITFEGYNSNSQKGPVGWHRMETYGGRLAENVTQAVSADIQAEAMVRCERAGYPIVMHTHDELTAEVPIGSGKTLDEMTAIMTQRPAWAAWWPIRGAGWSGKRYRKD